jgi:hypothetical protein
MRLHRHIAQAPAQDRQAAFAAVVFAHARARVIAVAMGDDRARHRSPGIDVEIAGGAVQPLRAQHHQIVIACHAATVACARARGENRPEHGLGGACGTIGPHTSCRQDGPDEWTQLQQQRAV